MAQDSRVKNSSRNIVFSMLAYILQIVLGFTVRRFFIQFFNEEYLGVTSLFSNILNVLSLAELGFGTAIVFAMYKPIAEGNNEEVRELLHFYKKCYAVIGIIVGVLGLCVVPFIDYFAAQAPNVDVSIYVIYIIYLFNSVSSYFFAYRRSLLYTNQRTDIESRINMCFNLLSSVGQLLIIFFIKNFYLYVILFGVANILNNTVVYFVTQKMYPDLVKAPEKPLDNETRKSINKNILSLVYHKVGGVVVFSTDSIIIYLMINAATLGKYSNYLMIISYITTLIGLVMMAIRGSVGNSIAKETKEKNFKLFNKLNFIYLWIVSFCAISIFCLSDPFIDTMLSSGEKVLTFDYTIVLLLSFSFYLSNSRYMVGVFKECAGLFYQDRFKSIIESIINLGASILLVKFIGLPGVIIGTILSTITTCLWVEPYVLNKHYFKHSTIKYLGKYAIHLVVTILAGIGTYLVVGLVPSGGIVSLIIKFAICAVVPNLILLACLWWMPEFKECVGWGMDIIKGFLKREKRDSASDMGNEPLVVRADLNGDGIHDVETLIPLHDENPFDDQVFNNDNE